MADNHVTLVLRPDGRYYEVELPPTVSRAGRSGAFTYTKTGATIATFLLDPDGDEPAETLVLTFATDEAGTYTDGAGTPRAFSVVPLGDAWRLANTSNRALSAPGTPCIAGFVIEGSNPRLVLVRVAGPALSAFGVSGAATDPRLRVYRGPAVLAENDNWDTAQGQFGNVIEAIAATGAFPFAAGSKDAALVLSLPPAAYTVHGVVDVPGEVLVELYVVP